MSTSPEEAAVLSLRGLSIKVHTRDDATVVECNGKLNTETAALLKNEVKVLIPGAKRIVLDLTGVSYMDSSGLGTIVALYVSARAAKCGFQPVNFNKQVREMLRITNLLTVFEACGHYLMKIP
jgi:anti-sigma B factor antagonist